MLQGPTLAAPTPNSGTQDAADPFAAFAEIKPQVTQQPNLLDDFTMQLSQPAMATSQTAMPTQSMQAPMMSTNPSPLLQSNLPMFSQTQPSTNQSANFSSQGSMMPPQGMMNSTAMQNIQSQPPHQSSQSKVSPLSPRLSICCR